MQSGNASKKMLFAPVKGLGELFSIHSGETIPARKYVNHEVIFYVSSGAGKVWVKKDDDELVHELQVGLSIFVPKGAMMQIKNDSNILLTMSLFMMPYCSESPAFIEADEACSCWNAVNSPSALAGLFKALDELPNYIAPDNSECRLLVAGTQGSLANFTLKPGIISTAVKHSLIEEIWLIQSGRGEVWLRQDDKETIIALEAGVIFSIPARAEFQLRNLGDIDLTSVTITMPCWPGNHVISVCEGPWIPSAQTPESVNPLHTILAHKKNQQQLNCSSALYQQQAVAEGETYSYCPGP